MSSLSSSSQIFANDDSGTGTVGGFFKFNGNDIYGITNNHVIANANNCHVGDPVFRYGDNEKIGTLHYWVTLNQNQVNYLDVALFKIDDEIEIEWLLPEGIDQPGDFDIAKNDENVYMMLQDGSRKQGKVTLATINFNIPFVLCEKKFSFSDLIEIKSIEGTPFSVPGQSGSIIFNNANSILGILLGTNSTTTKSYAIPFINRNRGIKQVFDLSLAFKRVVSDNP